MTHDAWKNTICSECDKESWCPLARLKYATAIKKCEILKQEDKESRERDAAADRALMAKALAFHNPILIELFSHTSPVMLN